MEEIPKREGVWGKIRETFASYFGAEGDAIDKSWTAKLDAKIDEGSNTIELQAPSMFIKDWIDTHYTRMIQNAAEKNGFNLVNIGIGVKSEDMKKSRNYKKLASKIEKIYKINNVINILYRDIAVCTPINSIKIKQEKITYLK